MDFKFYTYDVGEDNYKAPEGLQWNVIIEDNGSIEPYNIFEHSSFCKSLLKIKKKYKTFEEFSKQVRWELQYYFWSKCEWEIIVTEWPPFIATDSLDKMITEREKKIKSYGRCQAVVADLEVAEKVDVYTQIMLNWDVFIEYLWNNRRLIK